MSRLLVVIDMVNGFGKFGNFYSPNVEYLIPKIKAKMAEFDEEEIIFYCDEHTKDSREFRSYPIHCIKGSGEEEIVEELQIKGAKVIKKNSTNGLLAFNPLKDSKYDEIFICGCVSEICVEEYTMSILKYCDEKNLQAKIFLLNELISTFDEPQISAEDKHLNSMRKLEKLGAIII